MNTINKDKPVINISGVEIFDAVNISTSWYTSIISALNGEWKYAQRETIQSWKYWISECGSIFLIECWSYEELNDISNFWIKNFKKKNPLSSEMIDGREIPEYSWYFQKDGKYYLLGALYYSADRRNTDDKEGTYNGVLWNPVWYQENNPTFKQVQASVTNAWKILDWE